MNPHLFGGVVQPTNILSINIDGYKNTIVTDFVFAIVWPGIFFIRGT